eukprot:2046302-Pyramimonas_sp.AAC.1
MLVPLQGHLAGQVAGGEASSEATKRCMLVPLQGHLAEQVAGGEASSEAMKRRMGYAPEAINGRLAMLGVLGILGAEIDGQVRPTPTSQHGLN